jgi:hypothetical protein
VTITIVPGDQRTDSEREKLQAFKSPTTTLEGFATIIRAAEQAMVLDQYAKVFSKDILRVEVTGPKQPHLTLVVTYNHYLTETIQKFRKMKWEKLVTEKVHAFFNTTEGSPAWCGKSFNVNSLLKTLHAVAAEMDMDRHACSEAIDCMLAYYKVSNSAPNSHSHSQLLGALRYQRTRQTYG